MAIGTRKYEGKGFARLDKLDHECFPPGISYSKWSLHYYLSLPGADCMVAEDGKQIAGFILAEENPPLGHIVTLDVAERYRPGGVGPRRFRGGKQHFTLPPLPSFLLATPW